MNSQASNGLMIPMYLDALVLEKNISVLEAMVDFSQLPYTNNKEDFNPDVANISEEIVSHPFQDQNLFLGAGIHLHWALPDALAKGLHTDEGTTFPNVPNRWLVTRRQGIAIDQQWIVESDYLYPEGSDVQSNSITMPFVPDKSKGEFQPFRYMGRCVPLESWQPHDAQAQYLANLTAVGYGEPAFAAFYPNCHSVFGFYDPQYAGNIPNGLQYDVIGWYSNPDHDPLGGFVTNFAKNNPGVNPTQKDVENEFRWTFTPAPGQACPAQMLCFARITFTPKSYAMSPVAAAPKTATTITVANTGIEALCAHLAQAVDATKKSIIEDQLEALSSLGKVQGRSLDIGAAFKQARHEKGFRAISSGTLWTVRPRIAKTASTSTSSSPSQGGQVSLPEAMAHQLNVLNQLQQSYERALSEIEDARRQLFSDWYKYMICSYPPQGTRDDYPDIDEVKYFIQQRDLAPLQQKIAETGILKTQTDPNGIATATAGAGTSNNSIAGQFVAAFATLQKAVSAYNQSQSADTTKVTTPYLLQATAGPRYWQPNDPVLLMTGDALKPTLRHGQDGKLNADGFLECQILPHADFAAWAANKKFHAILDQIETLAKNPQVSEQIAFSAWSQQPWNVFLMEWEVEVFPLQKQEAKSAADLNYASDFITSNYALLESEFDLSLQSDRAATVAGANIYRGSSILTPHASTSLKDQIEGYIKQQILADYYQAHQISYGQQTESYFCENYEEIQAWYEKNYSSSSESTTDQAKDPIYTALRAYGQLQGLNSLSQSLGGFNQHLIMRKQTLQLDIADPLGFADYAQFSSAVNQAAAQDLWAAPQPLNDFNPIRSGMLQVLRLRLVDTFGQIKNLYVTDIDTCETMSDPQDKNSVALPPRLAQPARLNFRWLAADGSEQEMNAHPATTPICGWMVPNNLDGSLMVYDAQGNGLGVITRNPDQPWQLFPGEYQFLGAYHVANPYLQQVVTYIINQQKVSLAKQGENNTFLDNFIPILDSALKNIAPENYARHQGLALLMGRPMAVVRASVNLKLQGLPAIDESWYALRQDMQRNHRSTHAFDQVQFPIRLGEHSQLNDGLVGYWVEDAQGNYQDNIFYAPQSTPSGDPLIKTQAECALTINQSIDSPVQNVTMLVDPRGSVHATSGILPTKSISIPSDQYAAALQAIEVTFLSTPVLTGTDDVDLPLPKEPGYTWSWLAKRQADWTESTIGKPKTQATFSGPTVMREGWLKLSVQRQ